MTAPAPRPHAERAPEGEVTAAVERLAKALAQLEPDEPWPTNADLGGSLTGTRDDEFRDGKRDEARELLAELLEGDTIAEVIALHDDLVWQEPGEVFECVGCDYRVPGDEVDARTVRWHQQDMIRAALTGGAA